MSAGHDFAHALRGALDWWRAAGVDCDFVDSPQNWLAGAEPAREVARSSPAILVPDQTADRPYIGGPQSRWPRTLADFAPWWLAEPSLAPAGLARLAPRGPAHAPLMVLVPMPQQDDDTQLLSGQGGRLADSLLAALGLDPAGVYIASALPAHVAMPDWPSLAAQGLGTVLAHHLALAQPQRVLVMGATGISTLIGHDSPQTLSDLPMLNHDRASVPAMATYDLDTLLARPARKAQVWHRWLDWTEPGVA